MPVVEVGVHSSFNVSGPMAKMSSCFLLFRKDLVVSIQPLLFWPTDMIGCWVGQGVGSGGVDSGTFCRM